MNQDRSPEMIFGLLTGATPGEASQDAFRHENAGGGYSTLIASGSERLAVSADPNPAAVAVAPVASPSNAARAAEPLYAPATPAKQEATTPSPHWDFIQVYARYADILECDRLAHTAVAISLLSAVLNKKVRIRHGGLEVPLDLWMLLLSSSGMGRNTLLKSARRILKAAGLEKMVHNTTWGSKEAVYQQTAENPTGLFLWPEMSVVLKRMADPRFGGMREWLTNCYDEFTIPEAVRYRKTGKSGETPDIEFTQAPRLNILASSSCAWFMENMNEGDAAGGFIPRWTIVRVPESQKSISKPEELHPKAEWHLGSRLSEVAMLEGVADLSQVEEIYDKWYRETQSRFKAQGELAVPFFNRLRAQMLKFAVIFEVSANVSLRVSVPAMERAVGFARQLEGTIFELLPTAMSREGAAVEKVANRIRSAGPNGIMRSVLTREFQHLKYYEREGRLRTLLESKEVALFYRKSSGRPAEVLVHREFVEEYAQQFRDDKRA